MKVYNSHTFGPIAMTFPVTPNHSSQVNHNHDIKSNNYDKKAKWRDTKTEIKYKWQEIMREKNYIKKNYIKSNNYDKTIIGKSKKIMTKTIMR